MPKWFSSVTGKYYTGTGASLPANKFTRGIIRAGLKAGKNKWALATAAIPAARPVGWAARGLTGLKSGIKTITARAFGNPLAGRTVKGLAKVMGGRALGTGLFLGAVEATAGQTFKPSTIARSIVGAALNPVGAIVGTGLREGRDIARGTADIAKEIAHSFVDERPIFSYGGGDNVFNFPDVGGLPPMSPISGGLMPSVGFGGASVNVGGGGIDPSLLLLLGGAAGLGGYALGRRKRRRKRKKYKRRK